MPRPTRILALLLTVALLGCAGTEPEAEDGQLSVIADRTAEAGTARMVMDLTMTMPQLGEVSTRLEGVVDTLADAVDATITVSAPAGAGGGMGAGMGADTETSGELRMVDGAQYQRGGIARQLQPDLPEGSWLRTPLPEGGGAFLGAGGQPSSPTDLVAQLDAMGGTVTSGGRGEIRGVAVSRWQIEATMHDLIRAQAAEAPEQSEALEQQLQMQPELAEAPVLVELWADDEDRVRRMRIDSDLSALVPELPGGEGGEFRSVIDLELYDYGIEVAISAPDPDEVVELDMQSATLENIEGSGLEPGPHEAEPLEPLEGGPDPAEGDGSGGDGGAVSGPVGQTSYVVGPVLPGTRDALAQLPYPLGAERVQVAASRVVYAVPAVGERPVADLEAFYQTHLPSHGWMQVGSSGYATSDPDGVTEEVTGLEVQGHGDRLRITIELDRDDTTLVTITR